MGRECRQWKILTKKNEDKNGDKDKKTKDADYEKCSFNWCLNFFGDFSSFKSEGISFHSLMAL